MDSLKQVETPCVDDHQLLPSDFDAKGSLSPVAARIVVKTLNLARMGRPDALCTVKALAREVTRWDVACDKRLHRLMSWIQCTKNLVLTAFVGDQVQNLQLALYCDVSFAGDLRGSKSTSGGYLVLVGPSTFVAITSICNKQGAVSHSTTEADAIALDAAVRLEGIPALSMWGEV